MNKDVKILPLSSDPFIKTYLFNGFYLGILEANHIDITDILIKEFFNVFYFRAHGRGHLDFTGSGYVEKNRFITKYDIDLETITPEFIKNKIKDDYYLMVNLREKYLRLDYIKYKPNRSHDWLIYGYDDTKKVFLCCGYILKEKSSVFGNIEVEYDNLITAMKNVPAEFEKSKPAKIRNHTLKIDFNWKERTQKPQKLLKRIKRYYHPLKVVIYHRFFICNDIDGIKLYLRAFKREHVDLWKNSIDACMRDTIFLQDLRTLYEQKKVLLLLLKKITKNYELIKKGKEIENLSYKNLLLSLKYNIKPNKELIENIYANINHIECEQKKLIDTLLKDSYFCFT